MGAARQIGIPPGTHIEAAAALLIGQANMAGQEVTASFNGVELRAQPGGSAAAILSAYDQQVAQNAARYRASPEGLARARADAAEVARLQAAADALTHDVACLAFDDQGAVLDFLTALQPCSDRIGVKVQSAPIVEAFAAHALTPSMCVGGDKDDRDTCFRWLVGQALDGLTRGPAIHGIFHRFAAEWRTKWGAA